MGRTVRGVRRGRPCASHPFGLQGLGSFHSAARAGTRPGSGTQQDAALFIPSSVPLDVIVVGVEWWCGGMESEANGVCPSPQITGLLFYPDISLLSFSRLVRFWIPSFGSGLHCCFLFPRLLRRQRKREQGEGQEKCARGVRGREKREEE